MNYVGQLAETVFGTVKELYKGLNPANLTGCIDVIVVRQPDGTLHCSPFHVRFGKLRVLHSTEKVVDIEINGVPVNLHMKLGDNGEAFFVQQSEEQKESIPISLSTSPIPLEKISDVVPRSSRDISSLHGNPEASGLDAALRKKRWRKKKPKRKESSADSTSEEEEGTESEKSLEEKRKVLTSKFMPPFKPGGLPKAIYLTSLYYSFTEVQNEGGETLPLKEAYPYSDGELAPFQSPSASCQPAPKSDSELEMRIPEMPHGSESHMQWTWGRLPEMSKSERVDATKPAMHITRMAAIDPPATLPVGETTHFVAITAGSETDLGTVDSDGVSRLPVAPLIRPTPIFSTGKGLPGCEEPHSSTQVMGSDLETSCSLASGPRGLTAAADNEGTKCIEEMAEQVQEMHREVPPPWNTGLDSTEPISSSLDRRRGSVKRSPHLGPTDIYLEDLSNLDAEHVALYFPKSDAELSGHAPPEPDIVSRTSLLGDVSFGNRLDTLLEPTEYGLMPPILLSLCGGLGDGGELSHVEKFMNHIISYQEFAENPAILEDPNLVVQIHNKYYNWAVAAPMILARQAFQRNLPKSTVDKLKKEKMPKKSGRWWFSWGRKELSYEERNSSAQRTSTAGKHWKGSSLQRRTGDTSSSDDETIFSGPETRPVPDPIAQKFLPSYKKSLRLSSDQIKSLNLRDGPNEVVFSVTTQYQGTCRCEATIYLWNWDDKVVISDIDGTITKSDALGHILPYLGKDWTQEGIARLFHKIHLNGYKFLYCSARTIGLAHITKAYLKYINDAGCVLPDGPILLAPSSLFSAFHREVIEKRPEAFKIPCLTDIRNLFGAKNQPFHAAFGNRPNDAYAYKKVDLPESRIFTVNPKGELTQELIKIHKSTYERLGEMVDVIFPPVGKDVSFSVACPEFSQFTHWRSVLPSVDLEDLL